MGGPKVVGKIISHGSIIMDSLPKVTEVEIEYVFDNVKSVENLEVQEWKGKRLTNYA